MGLAQANCKSHSPVATTGRQSERDSPCQATPGPEWAEQKWFPASVGQLLSGSSFECLLGHSPVQEQHIHA
eukprot:15485361-Alexandrium_andersonii.AAC.4